jgi:hypothetical protein
VKICKQNNGEQDGANDHPDSGNQNINNQPGDAVPSGGRGLSDHDRRILEASGRPAEEIEALDQMMRAGKARQPNATLNLAALFARERDNVIADLDNKSVVTAKAFGTVLVKRGAYHQVRGWNAVGDHLGRRGHDLPTVMFNGVRHYDISFIGADEEAKREWEQGLRAMKPAALALLVAVITD